MQPSSCCDFSTKALAVAMISSRSSGFTLTNTFKRIMACLFVIVWSKSRVKLGNGKMVSKYSAAGLWVWGKVCYICGCENVIVI